MTEYRGVEVHHRAKFRRNRSIHCRDIAIFNFCNISAVRHLGFVMRVFGPPSKSIWCIIVQNVVGIDAVVSIICIFFISRVWLGLKVPIYAPEIVFGRFVPLSGESYH